MWPDLQGWWAVTPGKAYLPVCHLEGEAVLAGVSLGTFFFFF